MLFNIGAFNNNGVWQMLGWLMVFAFLIITNEIERRTKIGGIICFIVIPCALTLYFIVLNIWGHIDSNSWAAHNMTYTNMNSWFHYAKLYASTIGCIGFIMIKYKWGIGKYHWFKVWPFVIVAINILIAVASDFESAIKGAESLAAGNGGWWVSSEGVYLLGGWWNWANGIAGIINILCMTGWFCVYSSKDKKDMIWPDMTWVYIVAYDIWNFEYTYNNLPTHAWYCGFALLLAPTVANLLWNKGGWIQNRANTLATWCMFAQVVPQFQDGTNSVFQVLTTVYPESYNLAQMSADIASGALQPSVAGGDGGKMQGFVGMIALVVNVIALLAIVARSIRAKKNPYTNPIFTDQKDFIVAMEKCDGDEGK